MKKKIKKKHKQNAIIVAILFCIVLFSYYISNNYYQLILIQGQSMEPSIHNLSIRLVDKTDHQFKNGDIIAIKKSNMDMIIVKRIIGCPYDTVYIIGDHIYINEEGHFIAEKENANKIELMDKEYYVIGDNIENSIDSRDDAIGIIYEEEIIGKILN